MADRKRCCAWALVLALALSSAVFTQGADGEAQSQTQAAQDQRTLDIPLHGRCRPEILYHCAHVLTEHQRLASLKARTEGAAAAAAVASAAVEHVYSKLKPSANDANQQVDQQAGDQQKPEEKEQVVSKADTQQAGQSVSIKSGKQQSSRQQSQDAKATKAGQTKASTSETDAAGRKSVSQDTQLTTVAAADTQKQLSKGGSAGAAAQTASKEAAGEEVAGHANDADAVAAQEEEEADAAELEKDEVEAATKAANSQLSGDAKSGADGAASTTSGRVSIIDNLSKGKQTTEGVASGTAALEQIGKTFAAAAKSSQEGQQAQQAGAGTDGEAAAAASQGKAGQATQATDGADAGNEEGVDDDADIDGILNDNAQAAGKKKSKAKPLVTVDDLVTEEGEDGGDKATRRRSRSLLGQGTGGAAAALGGSQAQAQAQGEQEALAKVLKNLDMNPATTLFSLSSENAPIARCLRQAIRESQMSISPDAPDVSEECKMEVRDFYVEQAADVRRDPPLIASCASEMAGVCGAVTDPAKVLGCLKAHKPQLGPVCRTAVSQRQMDASEDIDLDTQLSQACKLDRERLCADAGWGEGAAQSCLEYHLHGDLLGGSQGGIRDVAAGLVGEAGEEGAAATKVADSHKLGLSPPCAAALFQRQIEESEDIRFNYRLSRSCAADKHTFCREVRPGSSGEVLSCLEQHMNAPEFTESCKSALEYDAQLRAADVRLDARFRAACSADVRSLCFAEEANVLASVEAAPGEGSRVLECMRRSLPRIRAPTCAQHVSGIMAAAYRDARLDGPLLSHCGRDIDRLCMDRAGALSCLRTAMSKHEPLEPECQEAVKERDRQAAADLRFIPHLADACAAEVHTLCKGGHLKGSAVIDCLADNRHKPEFSTGCRTALVNYLADAVSDVRLLHSLKQDCSQDITRLCSTTQPGEGRVLACLQQRRAEITGDACKRQMLRLLGLAVEDYRLDYQASQACKADVQQYCAGVKAEGGSYAGAVHACLRQSSTWDHLSPDCRKAQEALEKLEHEDVRLNPRIQRECPLAISTFCESVNPGNANVMACLQQASTKPSFPEGCRAVISSLLERASVKYSLNTKLKAACDKDLGRICPGSSDEPVKASDPGALGCLAANSSSLGAGCRSELASLVRIHLNRYRIGMPLTSVCDGDVMAKCNVDKQVTPFLMSGYIQACLTKNVASLHKPCWALISMFDESQYQVATSLEAKHWTPELQQEAMEKIAAKVTAEVRRELEPKMVHNLNTKVDVALERHTSRLRPLLFALLNAASILLAVTAVLALLGWYLWSKYVRNAGAGATRTIAIKDGRV